MYRVCDAGNVPEARGKFVVRDKYGLLVRELDGKPFLFDTEPDAQAFIGSMEDGTHHFTTET